ncbi:hypothetical protein OY671_009431, partial [Metschnikowia pulcherrima]
MCSLSAFFSNILDIYLEICTVSKLDGKLAVVTGGSSGIGSAIAQIFVANGARVVVTGRREQELDDAVAALGPRAVAFRGDVASLEDSDRSFESVAAMGKLDVSVANAGIAESVTLEELTEEHFDRLFSINVKGAVFAVQKALPLFQDGASIISMGSVAGVKGTSGFGVYGATKAALRNFVRA